MAEKKALLVLADALDLNGSGGALDKLKKKAAVLSHADAAGLKDLAVALGGVFRDKITIKRGNLFVELRTGGKFVVKLRDVRAVDSAAGTGTAFHVFELSARKQSDFIAAFQGQNAVQIL